MSEPVQLHQVPDAEVRRNDRGEGGIDLVLLTTVLVAVGFGVVMVYSASHVFAERSLGDPTHFLRFQAAAAAAGLLAMVVGACVHHHWWQRLALPLLGLAVLLLALVLVPGVGVTVNRSTRWLSLGPVRFQPSELAKVALVVYLAASLVRKGTKIRSLWAGFVPHLLVSLVLVALCMKQPDFGTSALLVLVMLGVLYVGGTRLQYLILVGVLGAPAVYLAFTTSPTKMQRLVAFLDPWRYRQGIGYHIVNSLIGLGSGGVTGVGIGESRQKLLYLPEAHTDFILSIIGEEFGFVGVVALILLFGVFLWRGCRVAMRARDDFGAYLAFGITFLLGIQAAINMGVVTGVLPTKGLTLPFVSYGGSSLVMSMFLSGVLLNISLRRADDWEQRWAEWRRRRGFLRAMRRHARRAAAGAPQRSEATGMGAGVRVG